jgi:putative endonuclease
MKSFFVYLITNKSRVVLYTGVTNDLIRRLSEDQQGEIGGFTKRYKVNRLVYYETFEDPNDAISREKEIKGWRRNKKNALVETLNPKWSDISSTLYESAGGPSHPLGMTAGKK